MSWVDWIFGFDLDENGNDWLSFAERLVKMAYGAFHRVQAPPRRRPRHRPTAWHLRRLRTSRSLRCGTTSWGARVACPCSTTGAGGRRHQLYRGPRSSGTPRTARTSQSRLHHRRRTSDSEKDSDDDEGEPVDMEEFAQWRVATSLLQHAILNARFHGVVFSAPRGGAPGC